MTKQRLSVTLSLVAAVATASVSLAHAQPAEAAASPPPPSTVEASFAQLDADAAAYLVLRPEAETAFWTWARRATEGELPGALAHRTEIGQKMFGVDTTKGWGEIGLDPRAPVVLSLFAIDLDDAQLAFRALTGPVKGVAKAPRVWSRSRLIARVTDEPKLRAALSVLMQSHAPSALLAGDPAALAAVFGAPAKQGKAIAKAWKKQKDLVAVFTLPASHGAALAFVRIAGETLIIDVLAPFDGRARDWKKDGAQLVKLVGRVFKDGGALPHLQTASGKALLTADAGVLVWPGKLLDAGKALGWQNILAALAGVSPEMKPALLETGTKEVLACDEFRPLAAQGPMSGLALVAARSDKGVGLGAVWTLRDQALLAKTFATSNEGLVDLTAGTSPQLGLLALIALKDTAGLRALPRPGVLGKDQETLVLATAECGGAAITTISLFAWPHLLSIGMDLHKELGPFFQTITNAALAMRVTDVGGKKTLQGLALGAFTGQPFHALLDGLSKRTAKTAGRRSLIMWRKNKETFVATAGTSKDSTVYGAVFGGDATLDWWWGQPTPPSAGGPTAFIAMARGDLTMALASLFAFGDEGEDPVQMIESVRADLAKKLPGVTDFRGTLKLAGDAMIANVVVTVAN